MNAIHERWYVPAVASGLLLTIAFALPVLWWIGFVALLPLFYGVSAPKRSVREAFKSGAVTAGILVFSLYYLTLFSFQWLPGSEMLVHLVRLGIVPTTLVGSLALGGGMAVYKMLRTCSVALNALVGAAAYMALEVVLNAMFQGYYVGQLAYLAVPVRFLMSYAALGGILGVSFVIAVFACVAAEMLQGGKLYARGHAAGVVLLVGAFLSIGAWQTMLLYQPLHGREVSVAILQPGTSNSIAMGKDTIARFPLPEFQNADLVLYPLSFVQGVIASDAKPVSSLATTSLETVSFWVKDAFPGAATAVTWDSAGSDGKLYNTFQFWKQGSVVAAYHKQAIHILDAPPPWVSKLGAYTSPYTYTSGAQEGPVQIAGASIGALICSELVRDDVVPRQANGANVLLSMGSEAMFADDSLRVFSLKAAQYRAVEYGMSVIRADALGPSALIDGNGVITALAGPGANTVLAGTIMLAEPRTTLYARFGYAPLITLLLCIFGAALVLKEKERARGQAISPRIPG